jgi:hypothetical protein
MNARQKHAFREGVLDSAQGNTARRIVGEMSSDDSRPPVDVCLAALFAKVPGGVAVEPDAPAAPITVCLTGNTATDARILSNARALRDAEELRLGHRVMLILLDP